MSQTERSRRTQTPVVTVDHFVAWGGDRDPPEQANRSVRVAAGVATVWDVLDASSLQPPLGPTARGSAAALYVTGIGGVEERAGTGYHWVFLVDGSEPPVGPDAYVLHGGERIEWRYVHVSSGREQAAQPAR